MDSSPVSRSVGAIVTAACWIDLHDYRRSMDKAGFDPACPQAERAIARVRLFQKIVAKCSTSIFPTLTVNDGAVAYRDLGLLPNNQLFEFIRQSWALFQATLAADSQKNGVRGVIAVGLRARGSKRGMDAQDRQFAEILEGVHAERIGLEEAIKRSRRVRRLHDVVPQLQANFAFTKAYEAEQGGSDAGFVSGNLYVDINAFRDGVPSWISCGPSVESPVKMGGKRSKFFPIIDIEPSSNGDGLRSGSELLALLSHR